MSDSQSYRVRLAQTRSLSKSDTIRLTTLQSISLDDDEKGVAKIRKDAMARHGNLLGLSAQYWEMLSF